MKEFKLTTMALLIGSLLMTNNVNAKIYDEDDGIITGSGALVAGGSYKIISVAGEDNTPLRGKQWRDYGNGSGWNTDC